MYVLGTKLGSSVRVESTLNHWPSLQGPLKQNTFLKVGSHYVPQAILELKILQPAECWYYKSVVPQPCMSEIL